MKTDRGKMMTELRLMRHRREEKTCKSPAIMPMAGTYTT
jgi:hypothetical protein